MFKNGLIVRAVSYVFPPSGEKRYLISLVVFIAGPMTSKRYALFCPWPIEPPAAAIMLRPSVNVVPLLRWICRYLSLLPMTLSPLSPTVLEIVTGPANVEVDVFVTVRLVSVVVPAVSDEMFVVPNVALDENRFVEDAVVEKKFVDVAFVVVELPMFSFVNVELVATKFVVKKFVVVALVPVPFKNVKF